jgi:hypothetical protein
MQILQGSDAPARKHSLDRISDRPRLPPNNSSKRHSHNAIWNLCFCPTSLLTSHPSCRSCIWGTPSMLCDYYVSFRCGSVWVWIECCSWPLDQLPSLKTKSVWNSKKTVGLRASILPSACLLSATGAMLLLSSSATTEIIVRSGNQTRTRASTFCLHDFIVFFRFWLRGQF